MTMLACVAIGVCLGVAATVLYFFVKLYGLVTHR